MEGPEEEEEEVKCRISVSIVCSFSHGLLLFGSTSCTRLKSEELCRFFFLIMTTRFILLDK